MVAVLGCDNHLIKATHEEVHQRWLQVLRTPLLLAHSHDATMARHSVLVAAKASGNVRWLNALIETFGGEALLLLTRPLFPAIIWQGRSEQERRNL